MVRFKFENLSNGVTTSFPAQNISRISDLDDAARQNICDCICEAEHYVSGKPLQPEPRILSLNQYLTWLIKGNASTSYKRIVSSPHEHIEVYVRKTR